MQAERHVVVVAVDADGDGVGYTPVVMGRVLQIHYVKTDYADTVDFAITSEATGQNIWTQANVTASVVKAPRQPTHDSAGAGLLYAASGVPVEDHVTLANDRVKISVAQGGVSKTGTFHVVIG